jgi:Cytidylyltransferase
MIAALLLGREGSVGFPGKNTTPVLGRPLLTYPMLAALNSFSVDRVYFSTDSEQYKQIGREHGVRIIDRPPELATKEALGEDAFAHGYRVIRDDVREEGKELELMVLLFCNAATLVAKTIDSGIAAMRSNPELDSAVSVSCYNMWSPLRARKINAMGLLDPFVPFESFADPQTLNCDRDSQGDAWFADVSVSVVRPHCLEHLEYGLLPQKWMGRKIYPIKQWGGLDVDFEWQLPQVEFWLRKNGFTEEVTPYDCYSVSRPAVR